LHCVKRFSRRRGEKVAYLSKSRKKKSQKTFKRKKATPEGGDAHVLFRLTASRKPEEKRRDPMPATSKKKKHEFKRLSEEAPEKSATVTRDFLLCFPEGVKSEGPDKSDARLRDPGGGKNNHNKGYHEGRALDGVWQSNTRTKASSHVSGGCVAIEKKRWGRFTASKPNEGNI